VVSEVKRRNEFIKQKSCITKKHELEERKKSRKSAHEQGSE
jgi:hypothetical protein